MTVPVAQGVLVTAVVGFIVATISGPALADPWTDVQITNPASRDRINPCEAYRAYQSIDG